MAELGNKVQWSKEKVEVHEITMNTHESKMDQFKDELRKYNEQFDVSNRHLIECI